MALFAGSLSAAELKLACFNHFTSYFKDFKCPADEIVSIRKMPQAEIIRQLAAGQLSMAITDQLPEDLRNFDVTELAVAGTILAIHPENPLKTVSCAEAKELLDAKIPTWRPLNGRRSQVHIYRVASNTPRPVIHHCGKCGFTPPGAKKKRKDEKPEKRAMVLQTENKSKSFVLLFVDPDGVAELPLASYGEDRVKLLSVDGVAPTLEHFRTGRYPLSRKIYLITAKHLTGSAKELVSYIKSRAFAARLYADGYLPIEQKAEQK